MTFIQKQALWVSRDANGNIVLHFPTTHVAYVEGGVATVNGAIPDENKNVTIDVGVKKVNDVAPDAEGNVVIEDYITGASINGKTITLNFKDGTSKTLTTQDTVPTDYVSNLAISGKTITVTFKDGTTKTLTTQDTTYSEATTSTAGLMSATDKTKLNGIATGAGSSMVSKASLTGSLSKSSSSVTKTITKLTALKPIYIYLYMTYQQNTDYYPQFNAITGLKYGNFTGGTTSISTSGIEKVYIPSGTSISITLKLNSTSNYSNVNYKIEVYQ